MRGDKTICEQRSPAARLPDGMLFFRLYINRFVRYLRDPYMEGAIHSPLATFNTGTMHQHVVQRWETMSLTRDRFGRRVYVHGVCSCRNFDGHIRQKLPLRL